MASVPETEIRRTPLYDVHVSLGARMVPFAGYAMPVQYPAGIIAEHNATRSAAGLFDVSHMGQAILRGDDPAASFERLVPGDITGLTTGRMRYTLLLNDAGGIRDDLMVTRIEEGGVPALFLVVNAGCKDADFAHIAALLADEAELQILNDSALLALQGPMAEAVLATLAPECRDLVFMQGAEMTLDGAAAYVTRSGYTGEDGFEISVANEAVAGLAQTLLAHDGVEPVGLGARDSLRLEAGLCLYGHDIDETTSPIEAGLAWAVGKRRRESADFPGAETILQQLNEGPTRKRVGIRPDGRAPVREGAVIRDAEDAEIGIVTSGGFGPTLGGPVAMGYVNAACAASGTALKIELRGRSVPATVADLPFVPANYKRAR
ncbi:MAG: glycine cleavage system aminomethyltransferase GcvT [Rhodospirillaceae bacterium]|nr:glycine cleavage system aminomethyltransferase GcvT [Rhodospirillaceae bacterium]MBT6405838.1 glycine cleavage system aminomethyltransferase GcvT [Rhodospirillaceae bacterium]MBT6535044.1 glycine cleavage system aminomethyltransferase GcvT [Rhodospirillaceae bacterium]MBT7363096.1 glycine cleavage system aminomethyltransferase GcvT [Rhodospirillaceae bacterium]